MSGFPCPHCGSTDTTYQMFSAGREGWCPRCEDTFVYPETGENLPRATLMRNGPEGFAELRRQIADHHRDIEMPEDWRDEYPFYMEEPDT